MLKKLLRRLRTYLRCRHRLSPKSAFYLLFYGIPTFSGGDGDSGKEGARADDIARQERTRAAQQAAELRAQQEAAAAQLMQQVQAAVAQTPLESERLGRLSQLEPDFEQILRGIAGGGDALPTELGRALQSRLLSDLNRTPEDVLQPSLDLLRQNVGQFAARRGIVGSGLELEQLGRAGVELTIQQAMAREQLRQQQVQQALAGQQSLEQLGSSRRGELGGFLQNLQALEDARRAREIGGITGAATGGAGLRQAGNIGALDRLSTGEERALGVESGQLQADRQARANQQAAMGQLFGTIAGTVAGAPFGPTGMYAGSQIGGNIFGGGGQQMQLPPIPVGPQGPPSGAQQRAYRYGSRSSGPFDFLGYSGGS